jgi:hypothetical protein
MRSSGHLRMPEYEWIDVKEANQVIHRSANIADEERRSYFDLTAIYFGVLFILREPVTRESSTVALSSGSLDKS